MTTVTAAQDPPPDPAGQEFAEQVYQDLLNHRVYWADHAVRALSLHARRRELTRHQVVHLVAQFEPRAWDDATVRAADRLLVDVADGPPLEAGELSSVQRLQQDIAMAYAVEGRHGPWPAW